jgi:RNA polymerase sigma-70 factor (ECF subfamily)
MNPNPNPWAKVFEDTLKPIWLAAQAGDEKAYRRALTLIAGRLRSFFLRRLGGLPDEVEDLVQETLMAIHLKRGTHEPGLPVTAWVLAIAKYKWVDFWRRRGRHESLHDDIEQVDEWQLTTDEPPAGTALDLGKLLTQVPQAQREAIELTKIQGLSVAEAAAQLNCSESAVKVNVHRGMKRLEALVRG